MVMPLGMALLGLMFSLLFLWLGRKKLSAFLLVFALLVLWVTSTPMVAGALYGALEKQYPPLPMHEIAQGDCIVVLGGAVGLRVKPRVDIELNDAVDRIYKAASLFNAGKGQMVIVAAGNQPWNSTLQPEAEIIRDLLIQWGVPQHLIVLDSNSRNTRENAINSSKALMQNDCRNPLLVTSAAHMPRSVAAFAKVDIEVFPVSTDVRVVDRNGVSLLDLLPQAGALAMTSDAMREWIAQKVYEYRDWN